MDEEKKGIDLPESDEAVDANSSAESSPPESENIADPQTPDEAGNAEAADDSPADSVDEAESGADQAESEEIADESPTPTSPDQLLSQDEIENMLGDVADQDGADLTGDFDADGEVKQADFQQLSQITNDQSPRNIALLMDVDLPVSIELGRTRLNISDILSLGPGSIVELDKLVGEPVDLLVNQKCVARGEVVVVEESFGLRITQLVSTEERLKNLQ